MRVRGVVVLLTYFGTWSVALWNSFLTFVRARLDERLAKSSARARVYV